MRISSKNESTHQENKHSYYIKRRVVLWKVTCRFTSNNVSFWKSDVLFLFERRVVLLVVKHLGWWEKRRGRCDSCDTCDSKKSKTLLGCARIYARESHLLNFCFWHCFVRSESRFSACILQGQQNGQTLFCCCFANCVFQNWSWLQRKLHFFVICSLFGAISLHILIGRCFETW